MSNIKFLVKTAIRDSRQNRGRLAMFMSSIVIGIAALVAINSFNYNLVDDIDRQAATLLGADLVAKGNRAISTELERILDSLPGERASEMELMSMAYIPKNDETQFVQIKAIKGDFPFYGKLRTEPITAADEYKSGKYALVDDGLMLQHRLEVGDSITIGHITFSIIGRLKNAFGSNGIGASFAAPIYIPQSYLLQTDLIGPGSLINYAYFHKTPAEFDPDLWRTSHKEQFRSQSIGIETVEGRKENLNRAFDMLNNFLNLVALVSLLLGCIGVASSVFIYIKNKIPSIAILRCIGMKGADALKVYFLQILGLGVLSVMIGAAIGTVIQMILPVLLSGILPFEVQMGISWRAIIEGVTIGTVVTMLFAMVPLISVRKISPLRTLRSSIDNDTVQKDVWTWVLYGCIILSIFLFLWKLMSNFLNAIIFTVSLIASFGVLFLVAKLIMWFIKNNFPRNWSFVFRQGLSNLFRPNNQTLTLIVSIGLGASILTSLFITRGLLLNNVSQMDAGKQPNMVLYGIESNQKDDIAALTETYDMPVMQQVPIVTMKLDEWKGRTKSDWLADSTAQVEGWAVHREARVTYRNYIDKNEKLIEGALQDRVAKLGDSIFISLGDSFAEALGVGLGDEMIWNVQGARMTTYVGSLRKIDFANMQARFFIVFPNGVLEEAPQFQVLVTKSPSPQVTADYRREVVKTYPNISVIDLGMILHSLNEILSKVSYVIRFMAGFSILTGIIVLISSLLLSKYQRIGESVLLRTLGANKSQILKINLIEYALIGALSALTGIVIAIVLSYFLSRFQFEIEFDINWLPVLIIFFSVVGLTIIIGLFNSRDVVNKAPLEVLRKEV